MTTLHPDLAASREPSTPRWHRILLPTDFSELSRRAASAAASLAVEYDAELHVVHVAVPALVLVPAPETVPPMHPPTRPADIDSVRARLLDFTREALPGLPNPIVTEVLDGRPAASIAQYARRTGIDLIVLGTHARGLVSRMFLGSISQSILASAACPVLLVPGTETPETEPPPEASPRPPKRVEARQTEFYEAAVQLGFYGTDTGGLTGKKDYVRKFWEDIAIKLAIRPAVERLLETRDRIRVVDLGSGSGEGIELLTHIPVSDALRTLDRPFVLKPENIDTYVGLDISPAMVAQGKANYAGRPHVRFLQADLAKGFPLLDEEPFDLYFSSYASLSHLTPSQLADLLSAIVAHSRRHAIVVLDLMGRWSAEWPSYWTIDGPRMLPYHMGYLLAANGPPPTPGDSYRVCYWTAAELRHLLESRVQVAGKTLQLFPLRDRSVLVGRHMGTGSFNGHPRPFRSAVNHLFHRDYRGDIAALAADLSFLDEFREAQPEAWLRIRAYTEQWNLVILFVDAIMASDRSRIQAILESAPAVLAEELRMLAWLHRNAARFPVVDFWASVMGPQVACVLRHLELNLPEGLGCGHGLLGVIEIRDADA